MDIAFEVPKSFKPRFDLAENIVSRRDTSFKKVVDNSLLSSLRASFCASRKKAAKKLANPRLQQIHFHTFRHWKATMDYHKTKDIMYVMSLLGHKRINNTQIYISLEKTIFSEGGDSEYTTRVAKTVKGARTFLGAGFEYITDMNGLKIFSKNSVAIKQIE